MDIKELKNIKKKQAKRIADFLLEEINVDVDLKNKIETTDKTLDGCLRYVYSEALKMRDSESSRMAWVDDDTVWNWVRHYYLEDSVNFEEKAQNTPAAVERKKEPIIAPPVKRKEAKAKIERQLSIFDFNFDEEDK